jgi:hypothetical protein
VSNEQERLEQLKSKVPLLFRTSGSVLYIGANKYRCQLCDALYSAGHQLTLLEAWEENIEHYKTDRRFRKVIWGFTEQVAKTGTHYEQFEWIIWWHGPEHILADELKPTLTGLEKRATLGIILGCPYGQNPQGAVDGNIYEIHHSTWYPEDFQQLGYQTATQGPIDVPNSHILAWKLM